ncbi:MAG: SAM-dependent methyltransferase [Steroidobacteraceae bacterium]|nr:SAM-dependent methyltransferase [Deltaproteobacteria bacterium]
MTPSELLQLSGGYWNVCALHAAVKLDVFTQMSQGAASAADISMVTGSDERGMTMLLNALAAMGLLDKFENKFSIPPFSATYLSKDSDNYLGYIILHHHNLMSGWARLDEAVKNGGPLRSNSSRTDDEAARESFLMGMFNLASLAAPLVVPAIDLSGRRSLLDLGGGPGTYAIHFCLHNPELKAVVYDLPTTRRFAEETIQRFGLSDRISFSAGDILADDIGSGYDVVWISQLLHSEDPTGAAIMLRKGVQAVVPGGLVIVQEFILDDNHAAPPFPTLFSLNMLLGTQGGQSYSQGELSDMMTQSGVRNILRLPLKLPNGAGIMMGIVA